MRGEEFGFEEEGVVAFSGVDADPRDGDACVFEHAHESRLFGRLERAVGVDAENQEAMAIAAKASATVATESKGSKALLGSMFE